MQKLMYRCGLKSVKVNVVYSKDVFEFVDGSESMIKHIRAFGDRGEFMCVYCIAKFNGEEVIEIMDKKEIDYIMSKSKSIHKDDSPWKNFYDEMAKKTVIRRLFKKMPQEKLDAETVSALRDDDYFNSENCESCEPYRYDDCIEAEKNECAKKNEYANKSDAVAEII